jgi:hypothetical protein
MARNGNFDLGGFRILPIAPLDTTAQPAIPTATNPLGDHLEKGFSSTPTASDAVALKPADVSAPAGGLGGGKSDDGATQPTTTSNATTGERRR